MDSRHGLNSWMNDEWSLLVAVIQTGFFQDSQLGGKVWISDGRLKGSVAQDKWASPCFGNIKRWLCDISLICYFQTASHWRWLRVKWEPFRYTTNDNTPRVRSNYSDWNKPRFSLQTGALERAMKVGLSLGFVRLNGESAFVAPWTSPCY